MFQKLDLEKAIVNQVIRVEDWQEKYIVSDFVTIDDEKLLQEL